MSHAIYFDRSSRVLRGVSLAIVLAVPSCDSGCQFTAQTIGAASAEIVLGRGDALKVFVAASAEDDRQLQHLVNDGLNVNAAGKCGSTPLHFALRSGNRKAFDNLLSCGADPNRRDYFGMAAVHLAAKMEDAYWIESVLRHGADPNLDDFGQNINNRAMPLFYAVSESRLDNIRTLVKAGAKVNYMDQKRRFALYLAWQSQRFDSAYILVEVGADTKLKRYPNEDNFETLLARYPVSVIESERQLVWFDKCRSQLHINK
jgi:hypothetical protein